MTTTMSDKLAVALLGLKNWVSIIDKTRGLNCAEPWLSEAKLALAAYESEKHTRGWRDISSAPKDGTKVLLWYQGRHWIGYCTEEKFNNGQNVWMVYCGENTVKAASPSHWKPLDEPEGL